ncbi:hypothetical protein TrVGV298_011133 [Trichoderma virens]|nr:hypothetical protein TrVGV298_011133 [Trichoderma virens]
MTTNLALRHRSGYGRPLMVAKFGVEVGYGVPVLASGTRVILDTHTGVMRRQASEWNHTLDGRPSVGAPSPRAVDLDHAGPFRLERAERGDDEEKRREGRRGGSQEPSSEFGTVKIHFTGWPGDELWSRPGETEQGLMAGRV